MTRFVIELFSYNCAYFTHVAVIENIVHVSSNLYINIDLTAVTVAYRCVLQRIVCVFVLSASIIVI